MQRVMRASDLEHVAKQSGSFATVRLTVLAVLLVGLLAAAPLRGSHAADPPPPQIPAVHGTTLTGSRVDLPSCFRGKIGVLVLGFSKNSRDQITPWGKKLAADYKTAPNLAYYEAPILASVPRLIRPMVLNSLKSSVPERAQPHFLPITEDEARWRALAHYSSSAADDAYILVVDQAGRILWQMQGPPDDASYANFRRQVDALRNRL